MAAPADAGTDDARFEELLQKLQEPDFMLERRREAWKRYRELPMPTRKSEEWRYTDISDLRPEEFRPLAPETGYVDDVGGLPRPIRTILERDQARSAVSAYVNGACMYRRREDELTEDGVLYAPIAEIALSRPELLEEHLFTSEVSEMEAKLWNLHVALLSNAYLLYVPKGVTVAEPIHAFHHVDRGQSLMATHTLIVAEEGAEVTCIDEFLSPDMEEPILSVAGAEIVAAGNATVRYLALQRFGRGARHFSVQHLTADRDTSLSGLNVNLGADLARADVTSHLEGEGSESEMLALWFGDREQHFDHHTLQHHAAPHAFSDLLYKGALTDEARSVFRGLIRVDPGAQLTDAYQTNRNLLLSERSHATTLPNLEIEADDVRCSHGATVGQVDESMLFYLMSRGLTQLQAERLLVFGFFDEVLSRVPVPGVRARLREAIEEKIGL